MHEVAISLAKTNTSKYKLGAVITDKRGRIVSYGQNSYIQTHPMQAHYGRLTGNPESVFLHAEMSALVKSKGKGYTIYVARVTKNGHSASSKPCVICMAAIKEAGLSKVVYYDHNGEEVEIKV